MSHAHIYNWTGAAQKCQSSNRRRYRIISMIILKFYSDQLEGSSDKRFINEAVGIKVQCVY